MDGTLSTMRLWGNGGLGRRLEGGLGERGNRVYIFYLLFILPFPRPLLPFFFSFPISLPPTFPASAYPVPLLFYLFLLLLPRTSKRIHTVSLISSLSAGAQAWALLYLLSTILFLSRILGWSPPRAWVTLTESIDESRSRLNLSSLFFLNVYC